MKAKPTRGPWQHVPADRESYRTVETKHGDIICQFRHTAFETDVDAENARLVAAAPEMLSALKLLWNDDRLMNAMSKAQAEAIVEAVASAEGSEP